MLKIFKVKFVVLWILIKVEDMKKIGKICIIFKWKFIVKFNFLEWKFFIKIKINFIIDF